MILFGILGILFGFASAVVMAIPVIRLKEVLKFENLRLSRAFQEQRRYVIWGLVLLSLSVVFQFLSLAAF